MKKYLFLTCLFIFLSCDTADFLNMSNAVEIITPPNGVVVTRGESLNIDLILNDEEAEPSTMEVSLYREGVLEDRFSLNLDPRDFLRGEEALLSVNTDELAEATYSLEVEVFEDSLLLSHKTVEFFNYHGELNIGGIDVYPAVAYPESRVILKVPVSWQLSKESSDTGEPYIRWYYKEKIIHEEYYSLGGDSVIWQAPDYAGFHQISAEVFPFKPGGDYNSSLFSEVSVNVVPLKNSLLESEGEIFYSLFNFNGNVVDEINKEGELKVFELLEPALHNDYYGLRFGESVGFESLYSLIPSSDEEHYPFSLTLDFMLMSEGEGRIFSSESKDQTLWLGVKEGALFFSVTSGQKILFEKELQSAPGIREIPLKFVVSLIPGEEFTDLLIHINGSVVAAGRLVSADFNFPALALGGSPDIRGAEFLADTFSVVYKDSLGRKNIYNRVFEEYYRAGSNNQYLLAQGFDGLFPPEGASEGSEVSGSSLLLDPGESFMTSEMELAESFIRVNARADDSYLLIITDSGEEVLAFTEGSGAEEFILQVTKNGWSLGGESFIPPGTNFRLQIQPLNKELVVYDMLVTEK